MRIISGNHKGRHIKVLPSFNDRPTTDFAKEALFNILNNYFYFDEITVLDLFCGTGSISFEFASHGTTDITLVDKNSKYLDFIEPQALEIFPDVNFKYINADVFEFIAKTHLNYDVIFADPPYTLDKIAEIPEIIFKNTALKDDTLLILEHSKRNNFKNHKFFLKERKYGNVRFSFFSKEKY
jgi:16S rRNA (guanine(966)-N(2))-methyltransferase RsmD